MTRTRLIQIECTAYRAIVRFACAVWLSDATLCALAGDRDETVVALAMAASVLIIQLSLRAILDLAARRQDNVS